MELFHRPDLTFTPAQLSERKLQKGNFPNQTSLGSFTPHSTIVEVSCFRSEEVAKGLETKNMMPVRQDLQVLCHEMTHWFDFFGSLWGREYIGSICRAYRAVAKGAEEDFAKVIELFDQDRRVLAPAYYRYANAPSEPHHMSRPWSIQYVSGVEIDPYGQLREDKPIFMTKFGENPSERVFARQPISVGSLLEVRAIASEIDAALMAIQTNPDKDEALVEANLTNQEFNALAYDHGLIEYNAAMHMLSVECGSKELFLSARLAAALAYIALNLGKEHFDNLRVPESFAHFGKRNRAFKRNHDRGFAFACLVFNGGKFNGNEAEYIEGCVAASNLCSPSEVLDSAAIELGRQFRFSNGNPATKRFFDEMKSSKAIIDLVASLPQYTITLNDVFGGLSKIAPPFMDSEANFVELSAGRLDGYKTVEMHDASHTLHEFTRNLLSGARGI